MKRLLLTGMLLFPTLLFAKTTIGFDASATASIGGGSAAYDVYLGPSLHLRLKEKLEFAPSIIFGYSSVSFPDDPSFSYSQPLLGAAAGLYFHVFSNQFFDVGLGPDMRVIHYFAPKTESSGNTSRPESYSKESVSLGMPLNFDVKCSPKATLRLSYRVVSINGSYAKESGSISASVKSLPAPAFNFLFTF